MMHSLLFRMIIFRGHPPYNFRSHKNPDGIYFDIDFGGTRVAIEGLEMLGGEPPFYPECVPDSYYMMGSNDRTNWVTLPGSARQSYRYYRFNVMSNLGGGPPTAWVVAPMKPAGSLGLDIGKQPETPYESIA